MKKGIWPDSICLPNPRHLCNCTYIFSGLEGEEISARVSEISTSWGGLGSHIAQGDNANQMVVFHHGKPSYLLLRHETEHIPDLVIRADRGHIAGHDVPDRCLVRVFSMGDVPDDDIPVGDDADNAVFIANRNGADIVLLHELCRLHHGGSRVDVGHVPGHDILDFHVRTSLPYCDSVFILPPAKSISTEN